MFYTARFLFTALSVILVFATLTYSKNCKIESLPADVDDHYAQPVISQISVMSATGKLDESKLLLVMRQLFNRPAFYVNRDLNGEDFRRWLLAHVITEMVLRSSLKCIVTSNIKSALTQTIALIGDNKMDMAKLYGDNFNLRTHIEAYGLSVKGFQRNMPDHVPDLPSAYPVFVKAQERILAMRKILVAISLVDYVDVPRP